MKKTAGLVRYWGVVVISVLLAAGCNSNPQPELSAQAVADSATAIPVTMVIYTPEPTETSVPTETPLATATSAPTETPVPTATATPTPHPLSIQAMRQRQYPGSNIVIEQTLEPGSNYNRYIASYLSEGLKIYALLTVPYGEKPPTGWPVIIFNHGYIPPEVYRTTERYIAYVDSLARSGYIVFRPDYRGHADSEGEASGAYGSPDYVVDVLNATAAMKQYPDADPARVGMWGHSMGGYITLRCMVITSDVKAGVIWAGVVASYPDLISRWRRPASPDAVTAASSPGRRRWRNELVENYGTPEQNPEFWNSISANSFLADLSGPVQIHHGTADTSVPVEFSEILYEQLLAAGKTTELYLYEGSDHNISSGFTQAMQRTIQFFDQYVKGQ